MVEEERVEDKCEKARVTTSAGKVCDPWTPPNKLPGQDYTTTYKASHTYQPLVTNFIKLDPLLKPRPKPPENFKFKNLNFLSSYNEAFTKKVINIDPLNMANRPPGTKFKFMKDFYEKTELPKQPRPKLSEYKARFPYHDQLTPHGGTLLDLRPYTTCQIQGLTRDDQPKIDPEDGGVLRELDIYNSSTHYDFYYRSRNAIEKYKSVKVDVTPILEPRTTPVFDESFLRHKFLERTIPKSLAKVPHGGMESETQAKYRYPVDELCHKAVGKRNPYFKQKLSKGSVMAIPGMYHSEYNHMGANWSLRSLL